MKLHCEESVGLGWRVHDGKNYVAERMTREQALLFAAAPELLEACEYALRFWEETGMGETWHPSVAQKLKNAIAKAKGEQP